MAKGIKSFQRKSKTPSKAQIMNEYEQKLLTLQEQIDANKKQLNEMLDMLRSSFQGVYQQYTAIQERINLVDRRSASTLRLLNKHSVFTTDEHVSEADVIQVEAFNETSDLDNEQKGLIPLEGPAADGDSIVVQIAAAWPTKEIDPDLSDDVTPGGKIDELSLLRAKVKVGSGEFPVEFEAELIGVNPNETRTFTIEASPTLGPYAGKKVTFTVDVFDVFTQSESDTETPSEGASEDTPQAG